jgi:hypothetical protein
MTPIPTSAAPRSRVPSGRIVAALFVLALAVRIAFGLASEFWGEDELQIYLIGLKFFTTGTWPLYGPDVVFFGEAVPLERVRAAEEMVDHARALLVVGTSLAVYSGLRFVRRARARGLPCALINLGPPMRGAELFDLHVDEHAGRVLPELATVMTGQAQEPSRS